MVVVRDEGECPSRQYVLADGGEDESAEQGGLRNLQT